MLLKRQKNYIYRYKYKLYSLLKRWFIAYNLNQKCFFLFSDAIWKRQVMLLQVPDQRTTVDLASNSLLYHLSSVEFKARVYCLYSHCSKVNSFIEFLNYRNTHNTNSEFCIYNSLMNYKMVFLIFDTLLIYY